MVLLPLLVSNSHLDFKASSNVLRNKSILLLESSLPKPFKQTEEFANRVVALNGLSRILLSEVGAWEFIKSIRLQPVKKMMIWENESQSQLSFEKEFLAHIVENNVIIEALSRQLDACIKCSDYHIDIVYGSTVKEIELPSSDNLVKLANVYIEDSSQENCQSIDTNLVIGADGFHSVVRKAANIHTLGWNHGQTAIVATLKMDGHEENVSALQRFTPTGPIALLPLANNHSSLVWSTTEGQAKYLMSLTDDEFIHQLNDALYSPSVEINQCGSLLSIVGQKLASCIDECINMPQSSSKFDVSSLPHVQSIQENTKRFCFPLGFQHATHYCGSRAVLIGDAAHRILPLAGQGVNLGFGDVTCLVKHLSKAVSHGADIGSAPYLNDYTTDRQRFVIPIAAAMEILNALYSTDVVLQNICPGFQLENSSSCSVIDQIIKTIIVNIRSAGMDTVRSSTLLKEFLIKVAVSGEIGLKLNFQNENK